MSVRTVIVVGGGLAGISAALALHDAGVRVTLLETRQRLGGRATSFRDPQTGEDVDNCQHVAMGCCTAYLALCRRLGVADQLSWTNEQTWILPGESGSSSRRWLIKPSPLPAPLHYLPSFVNAGFLPLASRAQVALVMRSILLGRVGDWRGRTFADMLDAHEVEACARERFFDPVVISACNLRSELVDAELAIKVFRDGVLSSPQAGAIAVSKVPLVRLYDGAAQSLCAHVHGSQGTSSVQLGCAVVEVGPRHVVTANGERLDCDAVILSVPPERAAGLVPVNDPRRDWLAQTTHSPIVGVHLEFDRPVLDVPHAVLLERITQWVFRKDAAGQRVHAVISAADAIVDWSSERIVEVVAGEVMQALCAQGSLGTQARLVRGRAIKEKRATFAATPAWVAGRPAALPEAARAGEAVVLAGCYLATGWPATMEGAVRSGLMAARACLPSSVQMPADLAAAGLARLLG